MRVLRCQERLDKSPAALITEELLVTLKNWRPHMYGRTSVRWASAYTYYEHPDNQALHHEILRGIYEKS